jgi:hypothetical protein
MLRRSLDVWTRFAWAIALLATSAAPLLADEGPDTDRLQQAVVNVFSKISETGNEIHYKSGSGFVVSREGYIVTNWHVVDGALVVSVLLPGEAEPRPNSIEDLQGLFRSGRLAHVLYHSKARDLAVLKVEPLPNPPLTVSNAPLKKNMKVYAIGYPGAAESVFKDPTADPTVTSGVVGRIYSSALFNDSNGETIPVVQHSAYINHGNSGGPLIDECGRVVGVNTWITIDEITADSGGAHLESNAGVYYASSALNLISFLQANNVPVTVDSEICSPSAMSPALQRDLLAAGILALLGLALVLAFRRPRVIVAQAVNRSAEAVSRRLGRIPRMPARKADAPDKTQRDHTELAPGGGAVRRVRLTGHDDLGRHSFEITAEAFAASRGGLVIGRAGGTVDIAIDHPEISRQHARIKLDGRRVLIEDLGSTNGTAVGGRLLQPDTYTPLGSGGELKLGPLHFDVTVE